MLAPHFIQLLTSSRPAAIAKIQGDTVSPVRDLDGDCIWRILTAGFAEQNGRNAKLNGRITFDY